MTTGVALISVMITGTRFVTIFMHMHFTDRYAINVRTPRDRKIFLF